MGFNRYQTNVCNHQPFLRLSLITIFLAHTIPGMLDNGINDFGNLYLNSIGFRPFGQPLAWLIKISHLIFVLSLLTNRFLLLSSIITIAILTSGTFMVHASNGWFVVGGGLNGVEFNFLIILVILAILHNEKLIKPKYRNRETDKFAKK